MIFKPTKIEFEDALNKLRIVIRNAPEAKTLDDYIMSRYIK